MEIKNENIELISLYKADLRQYESLSESQELWLGIVVDADKILRKLLNGEEQFTEMNCDLLYINLLNKIRVLSEQLDKFSSSDAKWTQVYFPKTIEDVIELKTSQKPLRKTILIDLFDTYSKHLHSILFDIISFLWILPAPILEYFLQEIRQNSIIPSIAKSLTILNPLETVFETRATLYLNTSLKKLFVESYLSYVLYYSYKYRKIGLDYEDIIQEGSLGLMKAVDKFDIRQGTRFKTFGVWWIKQSILRAVANDSRLVRLPVHMHEKISKLSIKRAHYYKYHLEEPSIQKVAQICGFTVEEVTSLIEISKPLISFEQLEFCESNIMELDPLIINSSGVMACKNCPFSIKHFPSDEYPINNNYESAECLIQDLEGKDVSGSIRLTNVLHALTFKQCEDKLNEVYRESLREGLLSLIDELSPRTSEVIKLRFGLVDEKTWTLEEIGQLMDVTRERIRQIERNGLNQLRNRKYKLVNYLENDY